MSYLLIFRKVSGNFPERTNEVVYGNIDAYKGNDNVLAIPWTVIDEDKLAENYKIESGTLVYDPIPLISDPDYKTQRLAEYAAIPLGDQLDAILKFALAQGLQPDASAKQDTPEGLAARIIAIKEKYPKPE